MGLSPNPSVSLSVCLSVRKVYCGKTADWIRMPFGVVSEFGRGMRVLDGGGDRRREWAVLGVNLGRPIVTNGAFATRSSQFTLYKLYFAMKTVNGFTEAPCLYMLHDNSVLYR